MAKNPDDPRQTLHEPDDDDGLRRTMPEAGDAETGGPQGPNQIFNDQIRRPPSASVPEASQTQRELLDTKTEFAKKRIGPVSLPESDSVTYSKAEEKLGSGKTYQPAHRPRTPTLFIMDDNQETAEAFRVRAAQVLIGRSRGDVVIPNDAHISERHVEIRRELGDDGYFWTLSDLRSTNGTYVRILRQHLNEGDCLLLGERYFRFSQFDATGGGDLDSSKFGLVQFAQGKNETRQLYVLDPGSENLIGHRQSDSDKNVWDDPFLDSEHAKISRDENGSWFVEDLESNNGTWIRVASIRLEDGISFQLGGQRFTFSVAEE